MRDDVKRVVELAQAGSWGEAIALLEERERREADRRHDLANLVSVAIANLEAMADGALGATPDRLNNVCEALKNASKLLQP